MLIVKVIVIAVAIVTVRVRVRYPAEPRKPTGGDPLEGDPADPARRMRQVFCRSASPPTYVHDMCVYIYIYISIYIYIYTHREIERERERERERDII